MWMEAMMTVKTMYPRLPTTSEIMSPSVSVVISTDKLRQRLLQESVNEVSIRECEDIMRTEMFQLHTYIVALKNKQLLLTDTLRNLEVLYFNRSLKCTMNCSIMIDANFLNLVVLDGEG